jgi:uncharacterized membrane protein
MNFETSKNLGGVGAILMFISVLPYISSYTFGLLGLVGCILLLVGMKGLADYYREAGIFNNALYGTITGIVGGVAFVAIIFTAVLGFISNIVPSWNEDWTSLGQINPADITTNIDLSTIGPFLAAILVAFVVLFVFVLVVAILYRKSLNSLREKSGVGMFGTAGTVLLVGAVLTIVVGLGLILVWIAVLLVAIAFFQLRPQQPTPPAPPPSENPVQL